MSQFVLTHELRHLPPCLIFDVRQKKQNTMKDTRLINWLPLTRSLSILGGMASLFFMLGLISVGYINGERRPSSLNICTDISISVGFSALMALHFYFYGWLIPQIYKFLRELYSQRYLPPPLPRN